MANYVNITDANSYVLSNKLKRSAWTRASDTDKTIALTNATRIIDRLPLLGSKSVSSQTNAFPRGGDTTVPQAIEDACVEIAFGLIDGIDPIKEYENLMITSKKYGSVSITSSEKVNKAYVAMGIVSLDAYILLLPYLKPFDTLDVERS